MQLLGQFVVIALRHYVVVVEKEKSKARAPRSSTKLTCRSRADEGH